MSREATPIPLADAASVFPAAGRTLALRLALALFALALGAACLLAVKETDARATTYFAKGAHGVVVMDVSASIDPRAYQRTARVLRTLADSGQRLGLVAFSDVGYEMLPLGTSGEEVRPLVRFFEDPGGSAGASHKTPWPQLTGGTAISRGLSVAREMLAREGTGRGQVLLVSDLDDAPSDVPALAHELSEFRTAGIELRIVPLFPSAQNLAFFSELAGRRALLERAELLANSRVVERRTLVGGFPLFLFVAAGALLLTLAVNEHVSRRLTWGRA